MRALRHALGEGDDDAVMAALRRWLDRQPEHPKLIGTNVAASLLGIQTTHMGRLREKDLLPDPVVVEGGHDAYIRSEVEQLAKQLAREREARERARQERQRARKTKTTGGRGGGKKS